VSEAGWQTLGAVAPTALLDTRLQLHHAAQWAAAAGASFLEPRSDDSHPNLGWSEAHAALVGHPIPGPPAFQAGLSIADARLLLLDHQGSLAEGLPLAGRTLSEAGAWLRDAIERMGGSLPAAGVEVPGYELPEHAVTAGAAFSLDSDACAELARWFGDGDALLADLLPALPGAGPARVWPHHFDLGSLLVVQTTADGGLAKSIGIGLSPGDASYAEPYWYVSPWPYPPADALPVLTSGGFWHSEGFVAAILTGTELVSGPPDAQRRRLQDFLDAALAASRAALGD
jgi:hypothetical protein